MKIYNPTDNDISVQIKGIVYTAPANGTASNVPAEAAEYWKTMLHEFVVILDDSKSAPVAEEPVAVVEAPAEVTEEEKPAKKAVAKKK